MNILKAVFLAFFFNIVVISLFGQFDIKPLKIGDTVPDIELNNMINFPKSKVRLSDLRGKLVILDFWNIECVPCIAAFPKMEALQKKFEGRIQIILANRTNSLERLKQKGFPDSYSSPVIRNTRLPYFFDLVKISDEPKVEITRFAKLFSHAGEPFHIWIDQSGVVRALTEGYATTEKTIMEFLEGKDPQLIVRNDYGNFYDWVVNDKKGPGMIKSFLRPQNEIVLNNIQYSSVFTSNLNAGKVLGGYLKDSATGIVNGIRRIRDIMHFYKEALGVDYSLSNTQIILNVNHPERFIDPKDDNLRNKWYQENVFCYELRVPVSRLTTDYWKNQAIFNKMLQEDLVRFFGIKGQVENRKMKVLSLCRISNELLLKTSGKEPWVEQTPSKYIIQNASLNALINDFNLLNNYPGKMLLVDETGLSDSLKVDVILNTSLDNISAMKKELLKYGLDIKEVMRDRKVLVLEQVSEW